MKNDKAMQYLINKIYCFNLKKSVGSRKSMQALDAPGKSKNLLITNKVITQFLNSPCTSISYMSFPCPTDLSRLIIFFILIPINVFASETGSSKINPSQAISTDPMNGSYLFQLILGLIVVLICIVVLAWFAKRMNRLQSSTGGMLKIIGGLSMGARERVVLLQVGSEQLLIGVSPGRINTLHVLETPLEDADINSGKTFATSLSEARSGLSEKINKVLAKQNDA